MRGAEKENGEVVDVEVLRGLYGLICAN